jgi:hypothetical protein
LSSVTPSAELIGVQAVQRVKARARQQEEFQADERRQAAEDTLLGFCEWTYPTYQRAPFLERIASELELIEREPERFGIAGEWDGLIIEVPPRHSKTETVSIRFPAWMMGRRPTSAFIAASYGDILASENGRKVRNIVDTQSVFPEVRLAQDSKAKNLWHTAQGGQFMSVGIGSGVIGFGGDVITIDDPFKKREEAESAAMRDHIDSWYKAEILTRRHRHTAIVIIMHRWHEDDLIGRRLAEAPHRWRRVRLPALAEEGDVLGRERGEAVWPWRYTREELLVIREQVGSRNWTSLYQQRPSPEEGDIFKWWPTYKALPRIQRLLMPIDTAYTDTSGSDYTAWTLWWDDGSRIGIMDAQQVQMETPEAEHELRRYYERIKAEFPTIPVQPLVRKKVAIDRQVGQHLRRSRNGAGGLPVVFVDLPSARGDDWKIINAKLVVPEFEGERMLIPAGYTPWLEPWLTQHKQFDHAPHDDWVETTLIVGRYKFGGRDAMVAAKEPIRMYTGDAR